MQRELEVQGLGIDRGVDITARKQRLGVGCKSQTSIVERIVERLDAKTIPCHEAALRFTVPDHKGKHAVQVLGTALAPFTIGFQDDFTVSLREKTVALLAQLGTQFTIVVDGAVENQDEVEFLVDHRLVRLVGEVDNGETAMAEAGAAVNKETGIIRPPPLETTVHAFQQGAFDCAAVKAHFTTDSTHRKIRPSSSMESNHSIPVQPLAPGSGS